MTAIDPSRRPVPVCVAGPAGLSPKEKLERGAKLLEVIEDLKMLSNKSEWIKAIEEILFYIYDKIEPYQDEVDQALLDLSQFIEAQFKEDADSAYNLTAQIAIFAHRHTKARELIARIHSPETREGLEKKVCATCNEALTGALRIAAELKTDEEPLAEIIKKLRRQLFDAKNFKRESSLCCQQTVYELRKALVPYAQRVKELPKCGGREGFESDRKGYFESIERLKELAEKRSEEKGNRAFLQKTKVLIAWAQECCYANIEMFEQKLKGIGIVAEFPKEEMLKELSTIKGVAESLEKAEMIEENISRLKETTLWKLLEGAVPLLERAHSIQEMCKEAATKTKAIALILERITNPLQPQEGEKHGSN